MNLAQVRQFAMSLPEVTEEPHFHYTSFRVRGKIFTTAPPEGEYIHVFVPEEVLGQADRGFAHDTGGSKSWGRHATPQAGVVEQSAEATSGEYLSERA
jgi:hypothetical protein